MAQKRRFGNSCLFEALVFRLLPSQYSGRSPYKPDITFWSASLGLVHVRGDALLRATARSGRIDREPHFGRVRQLASLQLTRDCE